MHKAAEPNGFVPVISSQERLEGREAILAILAAAAASQVLADLPGNHPGGLSGYYSLSQAELAGLVSGDMKKIESWVGRLDAQQATWLWDRLSQVNWPYQRK